MRPADHTTSAATTKKKKKRAELVAEELVAKAEPGWPAAVVLIVALNIRRGVDLPLLLPKPRAQYSSPEVQTQPSVQKGQAAQGSRGPVLKDGVASHLLIS